MKHISQIIAEMSADWQHDAGIETPPQDTETLSLTKKQDGRKMNQIGNGEHEKDQSMAFCG